MPDKTFLFSDDINSQYVIELYAGDYVMIEETFTDVLTEYDTFVQKINTCFRDGDLPSLKSAIHKIKPLFGFVGLTGLQTHCLNFENACLIAPSAMAISNEYNVLFKELIQAKSIIQKEQARLVTFNQS